MSRPIHAVILAGGEGRRMKSELPKVMLDLLGRPVIGHVIDAVRALRPAGIVVVGGARLPDLRRGLADEGVAFARQPVPRGTADAVRRALPKLPRKDADVVILCGDAPLITSQSLRDARTLHRRRRAAVTVLTATVPDPTGLGRIVRDARGRLARIVEEKDATSEERSITEVNAGQYVVRVEDLRQLLPRVGTDNAQGEYYLTDLASLAGERAAASPLRGPEEARGINRPVELAEARRLLRARVMEEHLERGVEIVAPELSFIESGVEIAPGAVIQPFVVIRRGVSIAARCIVGPFAHLRPGTSLGPGARVGNFVETKEASLGADSLALHHAFLGDATVGSGVNVGAGTVIANYDGRAKHHTRIGDGAFIGSGSILVAPVEVGSDARTGAGAVVTRGQDVPAGETVAGVPAKPLQRRRTTSRPRRRRDEK